MTARDVLREKVARTLNANGWTCSGGAHEPGQYDECEDCRRVCREVADAVLAVFAAHLADEEVVERAARSAWFEDNGDTDGWGMDPDAEPYRELTRAALATVLGGEA